MTYREKLRKEQPKVDADLIHIFKCPFDVLADASVMDQCPASTCRACWDREIEEVHSENEIP